MPSIHYKRLAVILLSQTFFKTWKWEIISLIGAIGWLTSLTDGHLVWAGQLSPHWFSKVLKMTGKPQFNTEHLKSFFRTDRSCPSLPNHGLVLILRGLFSPFDWFHSTNEGTHKCGRCQLLLLLVFLHLKSSQVKSNQIYL